MNTFRSYVFVLSITLCALAIPAAHKLSAAYSHIAATFATLTK